MHVIDEHAVHVFLGGQPDLVVNVIAEGWVVGAGQFAPPVIGDQAAPIIAAVVILVLMFCPDQIGPLHVGVGFDAQPLEIR